MIQNVWLRIELIKSHQKKSVVQRWPALSSLAFSNGKITEKWLNCLVCVIICRLNYGSRLGVHSKRRVERADWRSGRSALWPINSGKHRWFRIQLNRIQVEANWYFPQSHENSTMWTARKAPSSFGACSTPAGKSCRSKRFRPMSQSRSLKKLFPENRPIRRR